MKTQSYFLKCLLFLLTLITLSCQHNDSITVSETDQGLLFTENDQNILFYQRTPRSINGAYTRNNYIHPLWTFDGEQLTEDGPSDHPHQRGIFWTWHQTYIGRIRLGDGWECRDFVWDVTDVEVIDGEKGIKILVVTVLWKSPAFVDENGYQKPAVQEKSRISIYPSQHDYRIVDFEISLMALEDGISIGGSEDAKGYGGFSARIKLPEDVVFISTDGRVEPAEEAVRTGPWMDIIASFESSGEKSGFAILNHPDNPGDTNQWILRQTDSMQNPVYPGRTPVPILKNLPTTLKYRLIIHRNTITPTDISRFYQDYSTDHQ